MPKNSDPFDLPQAAAFLLQINPIHVTLLWHVLRRPAAQLTFAKTHCHPKRRSRMLGLLKGKSLRKKKKKLYKFPRCVYIKKSMYIYIYIQIQFKKMTVFWTSHVFIDIFMYPSHIYFLSIYVYIYIYVYVNVYTHPFPHFLICSLIYSHMY